MEDFYDLLGVSEDASAEEIDRAWRARVRTYHPDVNDDARANAQFKTLKAAHEVLASDEKRAAYDRMGHETYVRERLGGLPTTGQPGPDATGEADGDRDSDADASGRGRRTQSTRTTGSSGRQSGSNGRQTGSNGRQTGSSGRSRATGTARESRSGASGSRSRTAGAGGRAGSAGGATNREDAPGGRAAGRGSSASASTTTSNSTRPSESAARRGLTRLQYGWLAVLLAGAVYLAGLWQYLGANANAVGTLQAAVRTDPAGALRATRLLAPGAFALDATAGAAGPELLFPVGAAALAVAFLAVVVSFGRGSAYLYLLGGLAPVVGLAVGPALALPDGAVLALVVVLPLGATLLFAVDVGRYAV